MHLWNRLASLLGTTVLLLAPAACYALPPLPSFTEPGEGTDGGGWPLPPLLPAVEIGEPGPTPARGVSEGINDPSPMPRAGDDAGWLASSPRDTWDKVCLDWDLGKADFSHFYSWPNLGLVALGVGAAAPVANTRADESIQHWYQSRGRTRGLTAVANAANYAGECWVAVPLGLEAVALFGPDRGDYTMDGGLYEWSNRSLRAAAVGYPTVLVLFVALGAKRPEEDSSWHPFRDVHGVSGHTFIGAVPFLTAAAMTDDPYLKAPLLLGSMATGWSRIYLDRHYFSQVALGWWLAYLSVRAVDTTQAGRKSSFTFTPTVGPDGAGVLFQVRF
jgi:membrane-associated phospholipid phosphatase